MTSSNALRSMTKSTWLMAASAIGAGVLTLVSGRVAGGLAGALIASLLGLAALLAAALALSGVLTLQRQRRVDTGLPDLFLVRNAARCEDAVRGGRIPAWSAARRWLAHKAFGHAWMVGDVVQVKPLAAIRATLDPQGRLAGLPFMDEMAPFCGRSFRVYRVLDKIYDYGRSRQMRRLDDCVMLVDLRCDGSTHDRCEAECYLIWRGAWLERDAAVRPSVAGHTAPSGSGSASDEPATDTFSGLSCQYTELTRASRPMRPLELHGLLGPLVVGNVTFAAFLTALATRSFNAVQQRRGGTTYPSMPTASDDKTIRGAALTAGDWVRIKPAAELSRAMDRNSKNRGLWFDRDMLKHAGQSYRVRGRVDRLIDVASGKMITVKTPCITLDGLHASGEFQGFGEQHDFLYWREAWLERLDAPLEAQAAARSDAFAK